MKIEGDRIITDLNCKPTDGHQYLQYHSCHADQINRSITFGQTLRLKRICSEKNDLKEYALKILKYGFVKEDILTILLRTRLKSPLNSLQVIKIIAKKLIAYHK